MMAGDSVVTVRGAVTGRLAGEQAADAVETVACFGPDRTLVGVITEPADTIRRRGAAAVIFLTAGMVHRAGPGRMYVNLARGLAADGVASARFDLAGIGDSPHRSDAVPAEEGAVLDTIQVMDALQARGAASTFVLAGLCSGAIASFRTALRDPRVRGLVLLNPQGFDPDPEWTRQVEALRETRQYTGRAVRDTGRWRRALTGQIDYRRLVGVLVRRLSDVGGRATARSPIAARLEGEFRALADRGVRVLVVCSGGDLSIDYMTTILGRDVFAAPATDALTIRLFERTDHSFTLTERQDQLTRLVRTWNGANLA